LSLSLTIPQGRRPGTTQTMSLISADAKRKARLLPRDTRRGG
jgi:hypothetical protein